MPSRSLSLAALAIGVTLVAAPADAFDSTHWIRVRGGFWNPTQPDLVQLEQALRVALVPAAKNRGRIPEWNEYTFQYQGRLTITATRYIYVNALCEPGRGLRLDEEWDVVADGGACFFSAKYDTSKKKVYDLRVNGVG